MKGWTGKKGISMCYSPTRPLYDDTIREIGKTVTMTTEGNRETLRAKENHSKTKCLSAESLQSNNHGIYGGKKGIIKNSHIWHLVIYQIR